MTAPADSPPRALFPRLARGPSKLEPDAVARNQRGRLEGAMVVAVARHGFPSTTLRELVTLAGVSKSTFYEYFESKQDCFLATFDTIVEEGRRRAGAAFESPGSVREQLRAGLASFMDLAVREPAAASLVTVESLTLGAAGVAHRERASGEFESLVAQFFEGPSRRPLSPLTVRGIVDGIRSIFYRHLRAGEQERLPDVVDPLVDWALSYQRPSGEARAAVAAAQAAALRRRSPEPLTGSHPWAVSLCEPNARQSLSQHDRIIRAAATVGVDKGYEALSIPSISRAAGVSNQTFYDHFPGKREAFLAAFDALAAETLAIAGKAVAASGTGPEALGAGLGTLLDRIASDHLFARLAFFELPTAGPAALDRAEKILDSFGTSLDPGGTPDDVVEAARRTILNAIVGGIWAIIQHEIAHGRQDGLPEIAPQLIEFALSPLGVARERYGEGARRAQ